MIDAQVLCILAVVLTVLGIATFVGISVRRQASTPREKQAARDVQARIAAWWWMIPLMVACLALGPGGIVGFFVGVSFLALRELVTLLPLRRADHRVLVGSFFFAVPLQYWLIWTGLMGAFLVFVPLWALLGVSVGLALEGDPKHYLRRVAAIQVALLLGIYCLSHAPALLLLQVPGLEGQAHKLLVFLVVVTQASDVLQFLWGKALGRTPLWSRVSPCKTVEGLVGGTLSATFIGALLTPLLPFGVVETTVLAFVVVTAGWLGGLVMSAIKRDAGVKDYGSFIEGHGGVLDRVDSLVFAGPVLFHLVRWLHSAA